MKTVVLLFAAYVFILNIITSYRLIKDEFYKTWQKVLQLCIVWFLPFIGAMFVAYFLNALPIKAERWWQKHWIGNKLLSTLFFMRFYKQKTLDGYPSSMNAYGDYAGGWYNNGCQGLYDGNGDCGGSGE